MKFGYIYLISVLKKNVIYMLFFFHTLFTHEFSKENIVVISMMWNKGWKDVWEDLSDKLLL